MIKPLRRSLSTLLLYLRYYHQATKQFPKKCNQVPEKHRKFHWKGFKNLYNRSFWAVLTFLTIWIYVIFWKRSIAYFIYQSMIKMFLLDLRKWFGYCYPVYEITSYSISSLVQKQTFCTRPWHDQKTFQILNDHQTQLTLDS